MAEPALANHHQGTSPPDRTGGRLPMNTATTEREVA